MEEDDDTPELEVEEKIANDKDLSAGRIEPGIEVAKKRTDMSLGKESETSITLSELTIKEEKSRLFWKKIVFVGAVGSYAAIIIFLGCYIYWTVDMVPLPTVTKPSTSASSTGEVPPPMAVLLPSPSSYADPKDIHETPITSEPTSSNETTKEIPKVAKVFHAPVIYVLGALGAMLGIGLMRMVAPKGAKDSPEVVDSPWYKLAKDLVDHIVKDS